MQQGDVRCIPPKRSCTLFDEHLMLSSYIERREKFLHGRDTNRKSLPFEWGLEHLGPAANGNSAAAIHKYATEALNNSPAFYRVRPQETMSLGWDIKV